MSQKVSTKKQGYLFSYVVFAIIFSLLLAAIIFISEHIIKGSEPISNDTITKSSILPTVIIDAGHGGEDGGTVGKNGVLEKELNLIIANDLCDMLRAEGIAAVMTREGDTMLYDKNIDYKGRKKLLDLRARLDTAEKYDKCIFVSIHMNSYPEEKYHGLQVYYSKNDERSAQLAEQIQCTVGKYIQPENNRQIKPASGNIYLLDRIKAPAVLVECGFLSNREECSLLCTEDYRQKLTLALFCGICEYISSDST